MAIKRQSPPKSAAPRRRVASRREAIDAGAEPNEPIYTAEEKHQLILAHAAMRSPHDPIQLRSAWAGVAIALVVVLGGWWWASGSVVIRSANQIGPEMADTLKGAPSITAPGTEIGQNYNFGDALKQASDKLRVLQVEAATRQQTLDRMAAAVNATSTGGERTDLFQPTPSSTTSTTILKH